MSISGPVLTFIAVAVYGALHSLLASNSVKQLSRRAFGQTSDRFYRFFFNIVGGLTFLPVLAIAALDPRQMLYQLTQPWVLLTSAGQALAVIVLLLGLLQTDSPHFLGLRQISHPQASEQSELVINGLYCLCPPPALFRRTALYMAHASDDNERSGSESRFNAVHNHRQYL